jgi:hypothetical protein
MLVVGLAGPGVDYVLMAENVGQWAGGVYI